MIAIITAIPIAYAATEGTSTGTATVGNATPTITSVSFTDTVPTSKDGQQIDVNTEYWAKASGVDDDNGITDLDYVKFIIWGPSSTEGGADAEANHYTFTWTQATDTWAEVGPGASNEHLVIGNCEDPATLPGDFRLAFKLDKIAEKTATATWTIKIIVMDDSAASATDATLTFGVNFYAEIVVDDSTHGWTGLSAEDNDVLITSPGDFDIDVTCTSNAAFDLQAKGSGALADNGNTIPLVNVEIHKDTLASAVGLTVSYVDIGGLTALSAGSGVSHSFQLWISVPTDTPPGDYVYTLSVQIVEA